MIFAAVLGIAAVVAAVVWIERKRAQGPITYPLWTGNLLIPWLVFAALFALLIGWVSLPRYIGLALHGAPVAAIVTEVKGARACEVTYRYAVKGEAHTDSDGMCGLKAGDARTAFYDTQAPERSTLYLPGVALKTELLAVAILCFCLPTILVLWFMWSHVIGKRKKA